MDEDIIKIANKGLEPIIYQDNQELENKVSGLRFKMVK